jgi:hypothetical protein
MHPARRPASRRPSASALAVCFGALAFVVWRRRRRESSAPRDPVETTATMIAIVGGVVGLAVQFVPGVGVDRPPAPKAGLEV